MSYFISNYKRYLSAIKNMSLQRLENIIRRRIINIPASICWNLPWGFVKANKERLKKFKDIYQGQRCFIIANGPSLNKIDFSLLKNEITIGMNRIYLMEKQNGFLPNFIVCIDEKVQLRQFFNEYNELTIPCFFNWNQRNLFDKNQYQYFIKVKFSMGFAKDLIRNKTYNGGSATFTCLQLAYYMGFQEVFLIGKDHSYNTSIKSAKEIVSDGNENNHFIKGYYNKGQIWDSPSYDVEEFAYEIAKDFFAKEGRIIKDATIGGKLKVFEKIDFNSLF